MHIPWHCRSVWTIRSIHAGAIYDLNEDWLALQFSRQATDRLPLAPEYIFQYDALPFKDILDETRKVDVVTSLPYSASCCLPYHSGFHPQTRSAITGQFPCPSSSAMYSNRLSLAAIHLPSSCLFKYPLECAAIGPVERYGCFRFHDFRHMLFWRGKRRACVSRYQECGITHSLSATAQPAKQKASEAIRGNPLPNVARGALYGIVFVRTF